MVGHFFDDRKPSQNDEYMSAVLKSYCNEHTNTVPQHSLMLHLQAY